MQQLNGLDASFLYLETPNAPMHVSSLVIYDPSTAPDAYQRLVEELLDSNHPDSGPGRILAHLMDPG